MAISLTDIRCGCGGLCDSGEPCSMCGNVQACACGNTAVTHAIGQPGCLHAREQRRPCDWCSTKTGGSYEARCSCCGETRGRVCIDCLPYFDGKPCDGCQPGDPSHDPQHQRARA